VGITKQPYLKTKTVFSAATDRGYTWCVDREVSAVVMGSSGTTIWRTLCSYDLL
jgi:hypothetical protein